MIWRCFATKTSDVREDSRDIAIHCVLQEELWVFACGWYEISAVPFCSLFLSKPLLKSAHKQYQNSHYILTTALSRKNRALCYVAYVEKFDVGWQTIVEKSLTCIWMMVPTQGWTGVVTTSVIPNSGNNWAHAFIMVATFYKHGAALQLGPTLQGTHGILCYCMLLCPHGYKCLSKDLPAEWLHLACCLVDSASQHWLLKRPADVLCWLKITDMHIYIY